MRRRDCVERWKTRETKVYRSQFRRRPYSPHLDSNGETGTFLLMFHNVGHDFCGVSESYQLYSIRVDCSMFRAVASCVFMYNFHVVRIPLADIPSPATHMIERSSIILTLPFVIFGHLFSGPGVFGF